MFTPSHMSDKDEQQPPAPKTSPFKWAVLGVGGIVAFAHLGILGHIMKANQDAMMRMASRPQYPSINLPTGEYSSYDVNVNQEGYHVRYNANDPKVMVETRSTDLTQSSTNRGWFGKETSRFEDRDETVTREYTMNGQSQPIGNGGNTSGKLTAQNLECIKAEGAGESTGSMVGASMTAGLAPTLTAIPYVGWLAAGWAVMLGQDVGGDLGGEIAKSVKDC